MANKNFLYFANLFFRETEILKKTKIKKQFYERKTQTHNNKVQNFQSSEFYCTYVQPQIFMKYITTM